MAAIAQRLALRRAEVSLGTSAAVSLAAGLAATSTVLGALAPSEERAANALVRGLLVAAPMAAGVYAARVEQHHRLARLLYATGLVAFVTTLAETGDATLYTAGRTAGWLVQLALVVLVLSYPSGRLEARADRWIGAAMGATVALFYLPTLLVAEGFPVPSPWTSCAAACPANALFVGEHQAAWVEPLLRAPGALALFAVMLAVVVRLQQRLASATNATRRLLLPVLVVGVADAVLVGVGVMAREFGGSPRPVQVVSWTLTFALPAFSLVFAAGLLRARMFGDQALRRLAHVVQHLPASGTLAPVLGEALEDPSVQILFPANVWETRWVDAAGAEVTLPRGDPTRGIHRVVEGDRLIAAITYDPHLVVRLQLLEAAGGLAAVALDNQRLTAQAEGLTREAERSRARIAASAAEERRRIERDLHDGAQQRLVALRIELGLLEELAERHPERLAERIQELERSADDALDELRALAHGVCPPLLVDRGIDEALRAAVARCKTPTTLRTTDVGRYPADVETAAYFCVLEALQNVDKHADARRAIVELDGGGAEELRFLVHDDGDGATPEALAAGAGVTNMHDRVAAVGGHLRVISAPGIGTTVRGGVPIPRGSAASAVSGLYAGRRGGPRGASGS